MFDPVGAVSSERPAAVPEVADARADTLDPFGAQQRPFQLQIAAVAAERPPAAMTRWHGTSATAALAHDVADRARRARAPAAAATSP